MAEQQNTHILSEPCTVPLIIQGVFAIPLIQHHQQPDCSQHASQAQVGECPSKWSCVFIWLIQRSHFVLY